MIQDYADNIIQAILYLCFLALVIYIMGSCFFSVIFWLVKWIAA